MQARRHLSVSKDLWHYNCLYILMPSTVIHRMHYDAKTHVLRIVYVSGMVYDYKKVPQKVYEEMKTAPSKGEYLNYHIKGKYPYEKVTPPNT